MWRTLTVLLLVACLIVPCLSPATESPFLSRPLDRRCELLGAWAATYVQARNAGSDYYTLLELVERQQALTPPRDTREAQLWIYMLNNLLLVYQTPDLSPAQNRYETERWCQREITRNDGTSGEMRPQARD